ARVPVLNGVNHDEQRIFVEGLGLTVTGGQFVQIPPSEYPVTADNYQQVIVDVLGVSAARAAQIAAEYPVADYPSPTLGNGAFSTRANDAYWACPALQIDQWLAKRVPPFAYEFNDDNAPARAVPPVSPVATHTYELPYIFDLPDAPFQGAFSPDS